MTECEDTTDGLCSVYTLRLSPRSDSLSVLFHHHFVVHFFVNFGEFRSISSISKVSRTISVIIGTSSGARAPERSTASMSTDSTPPRTSNISNRFLHSLARSASTSSPPLPSTARNAAATTFNLSTIPRIIRFAPFGTVQGPKYGLTVRRVKISGHHLAMTVLAGSSSTDPVLRVAMLQSIFKPTMKPIY